MKKGVTVFTLLSVLVSMCSCSSYYYSFLNSNDKLDLRNTNNDFVQENDTVSVIYSFYGENAPVHITVHNKLDEPLYVDWNRSAIVIDNVATSFGSDVIASRGTNQEESFIPPKSRVANTPLFLDNFPFDKIPNKEYDKIPFVTNDSQEVKLRVMNFTEGNSPLSFRSYLTVYTEGRDGGPRKEILLERSFYISQLIKAGSLKPSNLSAFKREDGDCFYVQHKKGEKAGLIFGVVAISAAGVALEVAFGHSEY